MAAQDFGIVAIVLPNPEFDPAGGARIVNNSVGFAVQASGLIQTLSPNNPRNYDIIQGLLYSPDIPDDSPCTNATRSLIPSNVTTRADIPPGNYPLIGLAPWTDPACVLSVMATMRSDAVRGAVFFRPGNTTQQQPPPVSDAAWNLGEGGAWKTANNYPVYAIPGVLGAFLLDELAQYSGNISDAPFGEELGRMYDPHDTIRLYARMDVETSTGIPSLWVFLIIVLAILLGVVLLTSIAMHLVQRRQRRRLQRRVANGEIDLEVLGIKKLNVPQDVLDKMPRYTYTSKAAPDPAVAGDGAAAATAAASATTPSTREVPFTQPTCPICLDDFVHDDTMVRELPCNHIFHPECIDPFLRDSSSLCPVCKRSALPAGYCPVKVTNLMVRRERLIRRMRERNAGDGPASAASRLPAPLAAIRRNVRRLSVPVDVGAEEYRSVRGGHADPHATEMQPMEAGASPPMPDEMPDYVRAQNVSARRAWRREQAARQQDRTYDQQAQQARVVDLSRPRWRRVLGRIAPGLD